MNLIFLMKNIHTIFAISLRLAISLGTSGTASAQLTDNQSSGNSGKEYNNTGFPVTNTTNATSSLEDVKNMSNIEGTTQAIK